MPADTLWSLLVRPAARGLWQPTVINAELLLGEEAEQGSEYALNCDETVSTSLVIERLLLCTPPSTLQTVRHYPKLDCFSDYRITPLPSKSCQLQLKRMLRQPESARANLIDMPAQIELHQPRHEIDSLKKIANDLVMRLATTSK